MACIVVGPSSYLGSELVKFLTKNNEEVHKISFRPKKIHDCLKNLVEIIEGTNIETVYNIGASQSNSSNIEAISDLVESNITWPSFIASKINEINTKTNLICFGTNWQINEDRNNYPFNAYASSKTSGEEMLRYFSFLGVKIAYLKLFDTYGPFDYRRKIINLICDALIKDEELEMTAGDQVIDPVHISDVITAIQKVNIILNNKSTTSIYQASIRSGKTFSIKDLLKILIDISEKKENKIILGKREYRDRERFILPKYTDRIKGYEAEVEIYDGLKQTYEWRKNNINNL